MPLALPAAQVAWNFELQKRCAYASVNQAAGDVMYEVAKELITDRAFTCKGSSTGAAAGMDGVFRWANGNDAKTRFNGSGGAQSWVVITLAGGRGDVVFSYNAAADDVYNVWWSPSGVVAVAGTATNEPTATDQVLLNKFYTTPGTIVGSTAAGDRLVSIWSHPNKYGFRVAIARAGAWVSLFGVDQFTPDTYGTGITLLDVAGFYINGAFNPSQNGTNLNLMNSSTSNATADNTQKRFICRRTDGGGTTLTDVSHKVKGVGESGSATAMTMLGDQGFTPELQGGATYLMKRYGLFSRLAGHRGDIGWLQDWFLSRQTAADGDTTGALAWICVESASSMWWKWDGATAVVMS